jgi:hypothetical protein
MKKWLAGFFCVILFVVIVLLVAVFNLGTIVKTAVNKYGPEITKTQMQVDKADVSVFQAKAGLENFVLGNPQGFSSPHAITVGSIIVDVDESTLTKDTVIIDRIEVIAPEITYEIKGTTDNFRTMIDNMKKPGKSGKKDGEKKADKKDGKKVIIRDLILKGIKIKTSADIVGGDIATTTISEIHLRNIGEKQNGVDMAEAVLMVLNELYSQVISADTLDILKKRFKGLDDDLGGVKDEVKALGGKLKGLFD